MRGKIPPESGQKGAERKPRDTGPHTHESGDRAEQSTVFVGKSWSPGQEGKFEEELWGRVRFGGGDAPCLGSVNRPGKSQ